MPNTPIVASELTALRRECEHLERLAFLTAEPAWKRWLNDLAQRLRAWQNQFIAEEYPHR